MSAHDDALRVPCTTCGARRGKPCVYIMPPAGTEHRPSLADRVARAGQPMGKAHGDRLNGAWETRERQARRAALPPILAADPDLRAAARAEFEWATRERAELRDWLDRFADVLTEARS